MSIRKLRAGRVPTVTASEYIGERGGIFYDEATGQFRVSNGITPGGQIVQTALDLANGTADIFVNNIVVNGTSTTINNIVSNNETTVTGVLTVTGNASFVGNTEFIGTTTFIGPIINTGTRTSLGDTTFQGNVTTDGNLIVNGPSYFFGNITEVGNLLIIGKAVNEGPSIFNGEMTITGDTSVVGNVSLTGNSYITGNTFVTGPTTVTGNATISGNAILSGNSYIVGNTFVTGPTTVTGNVIITGNSLQTGQSTYIVSTDSMNQGAVTITGNVQGLFQPPALPAVMLHVTGQDNGTTPGRVYIDSNRQYSILVGRRYNGTIANPTQAVTGDEVFRLAGTGYPTGSWPLTGLAQIRFIADENQTQTNRGGHLDFLTVPVGSNVVTQVMSVSATTGVTVSGNVAAGNIIISGNIIGNLTTTTASINNLQVNGNISYNVGTNNATVTQLTSKATAVTCNGRTGQITTTNSSIAKGEAVTFTVNNSYITSATDVPVVAFQNGASANSYSVSVTRVQPGSFNITITNNGTGPLTDTIIINFAIIRVG